MDRDAIGQEIGRVRRRLIELDGERVRLEAALADFERQLSATAKAARPSAFENAPVTGSSSATEKLALFRRLFAGRPDVFPVRWENAKSGRAGYSPAGSNEWVKGVCRKPKVKCGECPHQAFIPPSDETIERHLRGRDARSGDFVAGVYPCFPTSVLVPRRRFRQGGVGG